MQLRILLKFHAYVFLHVIFTARRSYASAVLGIVILSVCLSVCPSDRLPHACFVTKRTADILISHERAIILVF